MLTTEARLRYVGHIEVPSQRKNAAMLPERLKKRLTKDRPMTSITLRIPADVVASMKEIAPKSGFSGYQALVKAYVGEGLRRDEAYFGNGGTARLIDALRKRTGIYSGRGQARARGVARWTAGAPAAGGVAR